MNAASSIVPAAALLAEYGEPHRADPLATVTARVLEGIARERGIREALGRLVLAIDDDREGLLARHAGATRRDLRQALEARRGA